MDLKEIDSVDPERHWYYQSKLVALRQALRRNSPGDLLIDVGAGSGFFAEQLLRERPDMSAVCVDPNYEDAALGQRGRLDFVRTVDPAANAAAGVFLFIDVLEHVEDDAALLAEYLRTAKPGALVVITVPAFQMLWSSHDVFLEHFRRYRLQPLKSLVESQGVEVLEHRYLFAVIFPLVLLIRKLRSKSSTDGDMQATNPLVNTILFNVLRLEHLSRGTRLFGLSAMVVGRVRGSHT